MLGTRSALMAPPTGTTVRGLIIVSREQPELWKALIREFGQSEEIRILLDRRHGERRTQNRLCTPERRSIERRALTRIEDDLRCRQYVLVRPHYRVPKE